MEKAKRICHKISDVLEYIIGIVLAVCLFVGGLGVIGYIAALFVGGERATEICEWMSGTFYVVLIKTATVTTLVSFVSIYLKGEANWINPIKRRKSKSK